MLNIYAQRAGEVTSFALYAAFILTCWPKRCNLALAAGLFVIGMLTNIGFTFYRQYIGLAIAWGASDSPSQGFPMLGLWLPALMVIYAVTAAMLLLPLISQPKALFFGKILQVGYLVPLVLVIALTSFERPGGFLILQTGWLVYGLLWFRIREHYPGGSKT